MIIIIMRDDASGATGPREHRNQDGGDGRGLFPFRKLVTSSTSSVNAWALVNSSGPAKKSQEISSKFFFLVSSIQN